MTPEGHNDLKPLLQQILKDSDLPLDCNELFDMPEVRAIAPSANRVSDYLGLMFRQGLVNRAHASSVPGGAAPLEGRKARWKYIWREKATPEWQKERRIKPTEFAPKAILDRPQMYITEEGGNIHIELPTLSITIKSKK